MGNLIVLSFIIKVFWFRADNMQVIKNIEKLFSQEKAEELADTLNSDKDDNWVYTPVHCPKGTGYSFINIHDENGEFVGKL